MKDEQGIRKGFTMRRFAFAVGVVAATYYIYMGDLTGVICWGAISVVAAVSKVISKVREARKKRRDNSE
jgi:hypothetical protein